MALLDALPEAVSIYELGPRAGLQNEAATVGTARKARLVEALVAAGLSRIEITSFVSPKLVPQLADADELVRLVRDVPGATLSALCPNEHGLARARAAGMAEIAVFVSASETHSLRDVNRSVDATMEILGRVVPEALAASMRVRGYVATAWACPYEGKVARGRVVSLARALLDLGCYEVALSDNVGAAAPTETRDLLRLAAREMDITKLALHTFDSRGQGLVNAMVALELGVRTLDTSIAGLGENAYLPGAGGNLATEDLVYMLEREGIRTGVDADALQEAGRVAAAIVNRDLPGRVHRAGLRSLAG